MSSRTERMGDVHLAVEESTRSVADILSDIELTFPPRSIDHVYDFQTADRIVHAQMNEIQATLATYPPCLTLDRKSLHRIVVLKVPVSEMQKDLRHTIHQHQLNDIGQLVRRPRTRSQSSSCPNDDADKDYSKLERYFEIARRYAITFVLCLTRSARHDLKNALELEWFDHIHDDRASS